MCVKYVTLIYRWWYIFYITLKCDFSHNEWVCGGALMIARTTFRASIVNHRLTSSGAATFGFPVLTLHRHSIVRYRARHTNVVLLPSLKSVDNFVIAYHFTCLYKFCSTCVLYPAFLCYFSDCHLLGCISYSSVIRVKNSNI